MAGTTKKATQKKSTAPAVLTGTVPEWANSTAIAQLLWKTTRRIQQLTQDGILKTEVPPGGGARKYRTCDTIQRYIDHVERKAQEIGEGGRLADIAPTLIELMGMEQPKEMTGKSLIVK